MNKEFIPYAEALALEELGMTYTLDSPVYMFYDNDTKKLDKLGALPTPLYQQAFRWFREKHDLPGWIESYPGDSYHYQIRNGYKEDGFQKYHIDVNLKSQEEAELACLKKLIEIVKEKK